MMGTIENRPRSRGVTQLMYVGDDDAVEKATSTTGMKALGVIAALIALKSKGTTRLAAAGIASYVAYKTYLSR